MHKLSLLALLILVLKAANAQTITSIGDEYEVIMSVPNERKIKSEVVYTDNEFVFASPIMIGDLGIECLNKKDLAEVWNVVIEENWKYNGIELVPDTVLFLKNGVIVLIGVDYNKKQGKATIYGRIYTTEGEKVETRRITTLVAPNEDDISIHYLVSKTGMLIYSISNLKTESSRIFQAAWIDDKLEEVKKQNTQIEGPQVIENYFYDEPRNALYLSTYPKTNKTFDFTQKDKYVIRFRKEELAPKVEGFLFEDFNAELLIVAADTTTGKPYIFGLAEAKNSNKISSTYVIALNTETLDKEQPRFYPISSEVVERIKEGRDMYDAAAGNSKAVNFEFMDVFFTKNEIILLYEDVFDQGTGTYQKYHKGQYVLRYAKDGKNFNQIYVPNIGLGKSKAMLNAEGQVRLFFVGDIKKFNKTNPNLKPIETTKGYAETGCFEARIDVTNKISYKTLAVIKPENGKRLWCRLSFVEIDDTKARCYFTIASMQFVFPTFIKVSEK
jgi:hypothetical protein